MLLQPMLPPLLLLLAPLPPIVAGAAGNTAVGGVAGIVAHTQRDLSSLGLRQPYQGPVNTVKARRELAASAGTPAPSSGTPAALLHLRCCSRKSAVDS